MAANPDSRIVVAPDGVRLAVFQAGPPAAAPVVLVHGYPDTHAVWDLVAARLATSWRVVSYDVRGAGASDHPDGRAAYRLDRLTDDFAAVCDAVSPQRPVHLVGHDWGGIQGWAFATSPRLAGRIASFTTIAGPALEHGLRANREPLRRGHLGEWWSHARRSWYIAVLCLPGGPWLTWRVLMAGGRWRWALERLDRVPVGSGYPAATAPDDGLAGANLYRANIPRMLIRPAPPIARAHAPVQVIVPERDRFISPRYYDAAAAAAPELRRETVPGSHWAPREQADALAALITGFAAEHGG
ncbi:MAG TPA: alpha/beta fold hydrolase [Solirubrobacteraceae bacterium]|nr:alpha/beta fold hydrolase [Solirubrobacteraceae bacterium]